MLSKDREASYGRRRHDEKSSSLLSRTQSARKNQLPCSIGPQVVGPDKKNDILGGGILRV